MNKILTDLLKGVDKNTYDIGKLLWILGVLVFLGLSITAVLKGQPWNPAEFGIGMGSVLMGGGAAMGLKKGTEPPRPTAKPTSPPGGQS